MLITRNSFKIDYLQCIAIIFLLALTTLIYWPGLDSRFLLDDFSNLKGLDIIRTYGFPYFIFETGIAGPSGRPLSLATFALQHSSWPNSPFDFKLVNLIIHLLNGILIYLVSVFVSKSIATEKARSYLPLLVTSLWLLHPIQLTTTLYVIQRMASLSTFFILLGVLTYLYMRFQHRYKQNVYVDFLMGLLILGLISLAILCKEIGILLPVYILCLEVTVLSNLHKPNYWFRWEILFLFSPLFLLLIYLAVKFNANLNGFAFRDYGVGQKTLTEMAVLVDYLKNIIIPQPSSFGLYHDDYQIIRSYFSGKYIFSISLLIILFISSIKYRVSQPVYSLSVLWFLGGHLLESTYLNLELYFEHRNYLPMYGILLGISYGIIYFFIKAKNIILPMSLVILYCGFVISITVLEVDLWSKPTLQILEWAKNKPDSKRAKNDLYNLYINSNDDRAESIVGDLKRLNPNSLYPYVEHLNFTSCVKAVAMTEKQWVEIYDIANTSRPIDLTAITALDNLVVKLIKSECPRININNLKTLLIRLIENQEYDAFNKAYFYEYLSTIEIFSGNMDQGLEYLELSNSLLPKIEKKIREINLLTKMGNISDAEKRKDELLFHIQKKKNSWFYKKLIEYVEVSNLN